ncbi:ferredoxin oxidoreductase [Thermocrinis sp.]
MYYVAEVNETECAKYNCKQCVLFCPEPNTLMFENSKHTAWVNVSRCKGCAICVYVCSDLLKRNCIQMVMVTSGD